MNDLKNRQRRKAYDARNRQVDKEALSRIICAQCIAQPAYRQAETVMWYSHCRSEVGTQAALLSELTSGKRIVVPYCTQDEQGHKRLGLWRLQDFSELMPGTWGILEPPKHRWGEPGKEIAPEQLDCIIVPGVAFDRKGGRLGNGAGYYDRLLKNIRSDAALIGICFEAQLIEQIAMEVHDVPMDLVITETTIYTGIGRQ
ncbi:MAG: 5-formyltetrahydrofolate cyclo-ligase [Methylococcaceae bacterium]